MLQLNVNIPDVGIVLENIIPYYILALVALKLCKVQLRLKQRKLFPNV